MRSFVYPRKLDYVTNEYETNCVCFSIFSMKWLQHEHKLHVILFWIFIDYDDIIMSYFAFSSMTITIRLAERFGERTGGGQIDDPLRPMKDDLW